MDLSCPYGAERRTVRVGFIITNYVNHIRMYIMLMLNYGDDDEEDEPGSGIYLPPSLLSAATIVNI